MFTKFINNQNKLIFFQKIILKYYIKVPLNFF